MTDQTSNLILPSKAWLVLRVAWVIYIGSASAMCVIYLSLRSFFLEIAAEDYSMVDPVAYAERLDATTSIMATIVTASFLLAVISYGFFYHRSMLTARALDSERATVSPTGMWWWYAVPVALLWKPLQGVIQVWRVLRAHAGQSEYVPWVFTVWWASWILGNSLIRIVDRAHPAAQTGTEASEDPLQLANYFIFSAPLQAVVIGCCIALWWITDRIYQAQQIIVAAQADTARVEEEPQVPAPEQPENA